MLLVLWNENVRTMFSLHHTSSKVLSTICENRIPSSVIVVMCKRYLCVAHNLAWAISNCISLLVAEKETNDDIPLYNQSPDNDRVDLDCSIE